MTKKIDDALIPPLVISGAMTWVAAYLWLATWLWYVVPHQGAWWSFPFFVTLFMGIGLPIPILALAAVFWPD